MSVRLGAVLPTTEIGDDPVALRDWAQGVEDLGFDRIIAYDHVLGAVHEGREPRLWGPYTERDPFHEPFVLFGYLAAVTRSAELMTGVLVLPQRQTALVAKQAAEVDLLSGGRLVLGVGTGWNYVEYEALGMPFRERAPMLDEQVEVLRRLWREDVVDLRGRFHRIDRAGIAHRPRRDIPVWFGGSAEASMARAVRLGDGYLFGTTGTRMQPAIDRLHELLDAAGRSASEFGRDAILHHGKGLEALAGEWADWQATDPGWVSVSTMHSSMLGATTARCESVDDHLTALAAVRDLVRA